MTQNKTLFIVLYIEFEVSGEKIQAVHMLPGYTHNIIKDRKSVV